VKPIAQPEGVHAKNTTWLAQTSVCVELTVKMTQTNAKYDTQDSDEDL